MKPDRSRAVVITGGAGGIGAAMVRALLQDGWHVVAVGRSSTSLEALHDSLDAPLRERLLCVAADVGDPAAPQRIDDAAAARGWSVAAVIHNAGVPRRGHNGTMFTAPARFWEVDLAEWDEAFRVNTTGAYLLSRHFAPRMMQAGWGRFIHIATSMHTMVAGGTSPYGPSKSAFESLASIMAYDMAGTGVTSNLIAPGGMVDTPFLPEHPTIARKDMLRPEVMVPPMRYLMSAAADGISGVRITARLWPADMPVEQAFAQSSAPAAWRSLAADRVDLKK